MFDGSYFLHFPPTQKQASLERNRTPSLILNGRYCFVCGIHSFLYENAIRKSNLGAEAEPS